MNPMCRILILTTCYFLGALPAGVFAQSNFSAEENKLLASIDRLPPPPKSINDLLKVLQVNKPDAEEVRRLIKVAETEPSPTMNKKELHELYKNKAGANEQLGRFKQMAEDCLKEIEFAASPDEVDDGKISCINAAFHSGDPFKVIALTNKAIRELPHSSRYGWQLVYQMLVVHQVNL